MPTYTIRVRGHLASHWAAWLEGLTSRTQMMAPQPSTGRWPTRARCLVC